MKHMKSFLLTVLAMLFALSATAMDFEFDGLQYTVISTRDRTCKTKDGVGTKKPGNLCAGDVEIPSIVSYGNDKYSVIQIGEYGFSNCPDLTSLSIPETVDSIGMEAFSYCNRLVSINIPESVCTIARQTFLGCSSLGSIIVPNGVTSIEYEAFGMCSSLSSIYIPESVVEIGMSAFIGCTGLSSIYLPESLTSINTTTFGYCSSLSSISLPESITLIGEGAFYGCSGLTSFKIPNFVTRIESGTFYECSSLKTIDIPESVTFIGDDAFFQCENLIAIRLPKTVNYIGRRAFYECSSLASLDIPETVNVINDDTFFKCNSLKSIQLPETLTSIGAWAFYGCTQLSDIDIPSSVSFIGRKAFSYCSTLTEVRIPELLKTIEDATFQGCISLKSIEIPESVNSIDEIAFANCTELNYIEIPAFIESIGLNAFAYCDANAEFIYNASMPITTVDICNDDIYATSTLNMPYATLSSIQNTSPWKKFLRINASDGSIEPGNDVTKDFEYEGIWYTVIDSEASTCRTKAGESDYSAGNYVSGNIVIPAQVSYEGRNFHVVEVGDWSFSANQDLIGIQLPPSVERIGIGAFESCISLTSIELPETMTFIGAEAFRDCWELPTIKIPYGIKSLERLTFHNCWALTTIDIPTSVTLIGESAFELCYKLEAIDIPESVTEIGGHAFYDCNDLRIISLPASLKSLSYGVFASGADNSDTEQVNYMATIPIEASSGVFIDSVYVKAVLYMPNARLADIRGTVPWNLFKRIIAKDGSLGFEAAGDDFLYEGIWYAVTDVDAKSCETRGWGNVGGGDIVIPAQASDGVNTYSVVAIGENSFSGSFDLRSVTLPATITKIGTNAFADCERLTSLVWLGQKQLQNGVVEEIGNPNLLLYVDNLQFAPEGLDRNVVVNGICERLELTPGYPFTPVKTFTANSCRMVKDFTQKTYIGICAGWETIVLPFDVTEVYAENLEAFLIPFAVAGGNRSLRPYWLYEGDEDGLWKEASGIKAGVPYIISMPNNSAYPSDCNVNGPVVFSNDESQVISPETTAPYVVDWASGRQFRPLWLPLSEEEAVTAMGLNSGISGMTDDEGDVLPPGSAFHTGVTPKPLEAYVTRLGSERAMMVMGNHSGVLPVIADSGLEVGAEYGKLYALSATDRELHIFTPEGALLRILELKAGVIAILDDLTPGVYIAAGRKVMVK